MMLLLSLSLLLLGVPQYAHADWVQYDTTTAAPFRVTGHDPLVRPADRLGRAVLETVGPPAWPPVDACAGRPDWTVITQLSPLTLAARPGVHCLDGEDVTDLTEAQRIRTILNRPACRVNTLADLDAVLPTNANLATNTGVVRDVIACFSALRRRIQQ